MNGAVVPFNEPEPVALADMTLPQLAEMLDGLAKLEEQYENMSGICATLRGLLLIETKRKLGHGKFMPFVQEHFPKSYKTATRYMRIAQHCILQKGQTVHFETLTGDLAASVLALRQFNLDLTHPVVAEVAKWVAGRGSYQLMLDFPGERGGYHEHKKLTPEEERELFLQAARDGFSSAIMDLDKIVCDETYKAPSITDAMLEDSIELARKFARDAAAWLKIPRRERTKIDLLEDAQ